MNKTAGKAGFGTGRVMFLQKGIIEAIRRAQNNDTLSKGGVEDIFGNLLKDVTIKSKLEIEPFKKMWEESKPKKQ